MEKIRSLFAKFRGIPKARRFFGFAFLVFFVFFFVYGVWAAYQDASNAINGIVFERLETVYVKDITQVHLDTDGDGETDMVVMGMTNQAAYQKLNGEETFFSATGNIIEP